MSNQNKTVIKCAYEQSYFESRKDTFNIKFENCSIIEAIDSMGLTIRGGLGNNIYLLIKEEYQF